MKGNLLLLKTLLPPILFAIVFILQEQQEIQKVSSFSFFPLFLIFFSQGVLVPHRGVMNTLNSVNEFVDIKADDKMLHFYGLGFDGSVMNVFLPLCFGGLLIARAEDWMSQLENEGCNVAFLTPSALCALTHSILDMNRCIVIGGEALTETAIKMVKPTTALINVYGPTEITIVSSCAISNQLPITIGRPGPNVTYHIVDQYMNLLPMGRFGEIIIGGMGVANGYLNLPERTSNSFLKQLHGKDGRFYKSGGKDLSFCCFSLLPQFIQIF